MTEAPPEVDPGQGLTEHRASAQVPPTLPITWPHPPWVTTSVISTETFVLDEAVLITDGV